MSIISQKNWKNNKAENKVFIWVVLNALCINTKEGIYYFKQQETENESKIFN